MGYGTYHGQVGVCSTANQARFTINEGTTRVACSRGRGVGAKNTVNTRHGTTEKTRIQGTIGKSNTQNNEKRKKLKLG